MSEKVKVSIVVPIYNVEKYVEKWKVEGLRKLIIAGINYASYLED